MQDVETTVFEIIAKKAKVESSGLSRATQMSDLVLDSIDVVEIIFEIEETFDISLPFNANQASQASPAAGARMISAGDVIDMVQTQIAARTAPKPG